MKTEEEKLRDIFKKNLGQQQRTIPDFQPMWEKAARNSRNKKQLMWAIAASLTLLATVGVVSSLNRQRRVEISSIPITSWNEPTKSLLMALSVAPANSISAWSSPTDFLLTGNNQQTKN